MKRVAVIGVGSAGLQTLCHLCAWLNDSWTIVSIHDPAKTTIGVGESTLPTFVNSLEYCVDFNIHTDLKELNGTIKLGTVFKKWRDKDWINPLIGGNLAIHMDTFRLKDFIFKRLKQKWRTRFEVKEQNFDDVFKFDYDYIVDCTGFPKDYSDYVIPSSLLINRGLVYNIPKKGNWQYTGHVATRNGWMFEIPLSNRQSYGYMYNSKITTKTEALTDFSRVKGVELGNDNVTEFSFQPAYAKTFLKGNVFKNGNRALFFEPLSALSLFAYSYNNTLITDHIVGLKDRERVNLLYINHVEAIRDFIYYYYHGGSTYDTPFWKEASTKAATELGHSDMFIRTQARFKREKIENRQTPYKAVRVPGWLFDAHNLSIIDKQLGYNYFR